MTSKIDLRNVFGTVFIPRNNSVRTRRAIAQNYLVPTLGVELTTNEMEYVEGWVEVAWQWWGGQFYFNNVETQQVLGILSIGGGIGAITAAISASFPPAAIVAGVLAGLLLINAGWIQLVAANGNGFTYNQLYVGGVYWLSEGKGW